MTETGTDLLRLVTVNPATGEEVPLSVEAGGTTDVLAARRDELNELRVALDAYRRDIDTELNARLDRANTRSTEIAGAAGAYRIETKAPTVVDYPEGPLREALTLLVDEGKLDAEVIDRVLVAQPVEYKLDRRELNKLLKHTDPDVVEFVAAVGVENPQNRPVTVKPIGGPS